MSSSVLAGLALVLTAGLFQGSFLLPSKWMRGWQWENYWVPFALSAYLLCPWALALATIPDLLGVYRQAPLDSIGWVVLFGFGWGIGAVMFGLGVDAIGLALGFAVILGIAATSGTVVPLVTKGLESLSLEQGLMTAASLIIMLVGVAMCSFAGRWKEGQPSGDRKISYRLGLIICIASGLLSSCGNLGLFFGKTIYERAGSDVPDYLQPNALWPLLTPPLFLCNAGYAGWLLVRNRTVGNYRQPGSTANALWSLVMGIMWMAGMGLYGMGADRLGEMGNSLGWAILMSSMVLVANALGVLSGEWKGAPPASWRQLGAGLLLLLAAIAGLGYANSLSNRAAPAAHDAARQAGCHPVCRSVDFNPHEVS